MANHFRSFSLIDSHKMKNINKLFDKNENNEPQKNDNCLITLSSVPEREQEKEDEYSKNFLMMIL